MFIVWFLWYCVGCEVKCFGNVFLNILVFDLFVVFVFYLYFCVCIDVCNFFCGWNVIGIFILLVMFFVIWNEICYFVIGVFVWKILRDFVKGSKWEMSFFFVIERFIFIIKILFVILFIKMNIILVEMKRFLDSWN